MSKRPKAPADKANAGEENPPRRRRTDVRNVLLGELPEQIPIGSSQVTVDLPNPLSLPVVDILSLPDATPLNLPSNSNLSPKSRFNVIYPTKPDTSEATRESLFISTDTNLPPATNITQCPTLDDFGLPKLTDSVHLLDSGVASVCVIHPAESPTQEELSENILEVFHRTNNRTGEEENEEEGEKLGPGYSINNLNDPLYRGAHLTVLESLISVLTYAQSDKLSNVALGNLLKLISLHLPKPNLFSDTVHLLMNRLDTGDHTELLFHYCNLCLRPRVSAEDLCNICTDPKRKVNYFLYLPIGPQLARLLSRPEILEAIKNYRYSRTKLCNDNIEDVIDSETYKNVNDAAVAGLSKLTLQWNTDGVSPFSSSSYSEYPFFFVINELPPNLRYRPENMIIGGLWGGKVKPSPNVFLRPIFTELEKLRQDGLDVKYSDEVINYKIVPICGTCDTPAKATFLNINSHSGFYACPKCLVEGEKSERSSMVMVFPHQDELVLRDKDSHMQHCREAAAQKDTVCGVKAASLLFFMVPDVIKSTSIDGMHCAYMGVTKQILSLLFDSLHTDKPFSLHSKLNEANKMVLSVKLPHFVQREFAPFDKLSFWKASMCRNFLLYVALPIFSVLMKKEYFDNLKLLVFGLSLCNSQSISLSNLQLADKLLCQFVKDFELLYGIRRMTLNIHLLRHVAASVLECGPLWCSSCFPFENLNGLLMTLIHGSTAPSLQIVRNLNILTQLPLLIKKLPDGPVKTFCEQLTHRYRRLKKNESIDEESFSVGTYTHYEEELLQGKNVLQFTRLFKKGLLYVSEIYQRGVKVSSYVKYKFADSDYFGKVVRFLKDPAMSCPQCSDSCKCKFYAVVQLCVVEPAYTIENSCENCHIKKYCFPPNSMYIINIDCLSTVCHLVDIENQSFICEPLNSFELE